MATNSGYVPISRGFNEHLDLMSDAQVAVYLRLHLLCDFENGALEVKVASLFPPHRKTQKTVRKILAELERDGYIEQIKATNQMELTVITITNYKRAADLAEKKSRKAAKKVKERVYCGRDGCHFGRIIIIEDGKEYDDACPHCEALKKPVDNSKK